MQVNIRRYLRADNNLKTATKPFRTIDYGNTIEAAIFPRNPIILVD